MCSVVVGPVSRLWNVEVVLCNPDNPARGTIVSSGHSTQEAATAYGKKLCKNAQGCHDPQVRVRATREPSANYFETAIRYANEKPGA